MNDRKQQIRKVLKTYTNRYTSAMMADRMAQIESESAAAQDWFEEQRKNMNISDTEIMEITEELAKEAQKEGRAFFCNIKKSNK